LKSPTHRVFEPKARKRPHQRHFGLPSKPTDSLVRGIVTSLGDIKHQRCLSELSPLRVFPLKRLRKNLISAMELDIVFQPVAAVHRFNEPKKMQDGRLAKQTVVWNPIWDHAPNGAYRKSKRLSSLVTDVVTRHCGANISHLLERLSINIWRMPMRHFDGICRAIRAKLVVAACAASYHRKSPEALKRSEALISNPYRKVRVNRTARVRNCRHAGYAAMRLSNDIGLVRDSLKCTKCTVAVCTAKWFTPFG